MSSTDIQHPSLRAQPLSSVTPQRPLCPQAAFDVVALVASAGGFRAIRAILAALPADFPAALVFQMHLAPRRPSLLVELLGRRLPLPVEWAAHGQPLRQGTVTVVPPGQHMRVSPWGVVTLTAWAHRHSSHTCDELLSSLAASFQRRALGVVLTGRLSDGARGVQTLSRHGGRVLVQDPLTAEAPGMPLAALQTGCADFVLPLSAIPAALTTFVTGYNGAGVVTVPPASPPRP
jgi:two-component system chemotaxis response regulator CheB